MDVSLHRSDNDRIAFPPIRTLLEHCFLDDFKACFGRVGTHEELGQEEGLFFKGIAHAVKGWNHIFVDDGKCVPSFIQKRCNRRLSR